MFSLTCPKCGEADAVRLNPADLGAFECAECGGKFTREEIDLTLQCSAIEIQFNATTYSQATREEMADLIREWSAVLKWIDTAKRFATAGTNDDKPATLAG